LLDLSGLAATLVLPEIALHRKGEAHLTLLSTREAEALSAHLPESRWQSIFETLDWEIALLSRFDLLREERLSEATRFSVIRRVHCPSLNAFRQRLAQASGMDLAETLPHVTLYTAGHERGIGLSSLAEHGHRRLRPLAADEIREILGPI
jgi:hypothetical protein